MLQVTFSKFLIGTKLDRQTAVRSFATNSGYHVSELPFQTAHNFPILYIFVASGVALRIYTYSFHALYHFIPALSRDYMSAGARNPLFLDKTDCTLFNSNRSLMVLIQSTTSLHCTQTNTMSCRFCSSSCCPFNRTIAWIKDTESKPAVGRLMPWLW